MKFLYNPYCIEIEWEESQCCILQIENQKAFVDLIADLHNKIFQGDGDAILSDNGNCLEIGKMAELIIDPFSIDLNNRKIKNKIYKELSEYGIQMHYSDYSRLQSQISEFLGQLVGEMSYPLIFQGNVGIEEILKVANVALDYEYESIADKICAYIKLLSTACGINVIFFVDLHRFVSNEDVDEIIKEAKYYNINVIFINSSGMDYFFENEVRYILDSTLCFWKR